MIDLRSDTVTKPSAAMLETMQAAKVGDDVFNEDPTVQELQQYTSELFGKEAALFCPSGTMTNQIAIKVQTQPGDEVICDEGAHIHYYEGGGIAFNSGATTRPLSGERGVFTSTQIEDTLRPPDSHFPNTSLVSIENTCNRGGGKVFDFKEIKRIRALCDQQRLNLHLDGARLFNAIVKTGIGPAEYGELFDTISICLSKGLGAPAGSLLIGKASMINHAHRIRKILGGGMRQAGYLAAAGLFALKNNVNRLVDDHRLAEDIGNMLSTCEFVDKVFEVETNMVVFELRSEIDCSHFLNHLKDHNILAFEVGKQRIRFVTHLDLPKNTGEQIKQALLAYSNV